MGVEPKSDSDGPDSRFPTGCSQTFNQTNTENSESSVLIVTHIPRHPLQGELIHAVSMLVRRLRGGEGIRERIWVE